MSELRVVTCGTGTAGAAVLKEALRLPWIDVANVLVYTEAKAGRDIGELVGLPPAGVTTTLDFEEIVAMDDVDVVVYCAQEIDDRSNDAPIIRLLESGKNVVTPLAYHWPEARREGLREELEAACRKGQSTFHANGLNPGWLMERLVPVLTNLSHDIERIQIEEFFDCARSSEPMITVMGLGMSVEQAKEMVIARQMADLYLRQPIVLTCGLLGVEVERIEAEQEYFITDGDLQCEGYAVAAGTVGAILNRWTAYVDGSPFFVYDGNWFLTRAMQPIEASTLENWRIMIEGRPSVQMFMEVSASVLHNALHWEDDPTSPGWYAVAIPLLQMLPSVQAAPPGVLPAAPVGPHWRAGLGRSAMPTQT